MDINLVIAVTDGDWFEMLRKQPNLSEVNFWAPSAANFRALQPGEMFLFKLHAPRNVIVGGGIFAYSNTLPCSLAWEAFGEGNGARSAQEMRSRIARYRHIDPGDRSDFDIGCRILTQPFFFEERDWIRVPASWSPNIVSFKTYTTTDAEGLALWEKINWRLGRLMTPEIPEGSKRFGEPYLIRPRLGQGAFRVLVTDIYRRRCAITQERTLPALEAAHIRPYGDGGAHEATNGLLLRRDIHSLFDAGYVTVTPELRFEVSRRIREEFDNGKHYYDLHGHQIQLPSESGQHPNPDALRWHNENCFKG
ncbi:putative restriction endonuclease [Nitrosospira multiformis]|uniref:Putative restriction endonuclease n=1 Tax=Nitrosospira multiformis TaxID=1231 RepID=A0A2T5I4C8_9PROT|nr:HNH endonuclease [Nitrosospira multiformis]PTQ78684.1 putative restriction endonuclease [Nitrosospira multiformis]